MEHLLGNTVLLTGVPRSGTTLCCHLLNRHINTVSLHEPISPGSFDAKGNNDAALRVIQKFAQQSRHQLINEGTVETKQRDGKLPTNPVVGSTSMGLRKEDVSLGVVSIDKALDDEFTLVVKHNALFTALLEGLKHSFPVFAIIRNPMAVLASWQSVAMPVNKGYVPMGEKFDPALKKSLANQPDLLERQLLLLEWFYSRYSRLVPDSNLVTYEDVIASGGSVLSKISGDHVTKDNHLQEQLTNTGLANKSLGRLHDRLVARVEIYQPFYASADITEQFEKMTS